MTRTPSALRAVLKRRILEQLREVEVLTTGQIAARLSHSSADVRNALDSLARDGDVTMLGIVNRGPGARAGGHRCWKLFAKGGAR